MTPKEKADELLSKFVSINLSQVNELVDGIRIRLAKQCVLIVVDEILDMVKHTPIEDIETDYWKEVKQEIENN